MKNKKVILVIAIIAIILVMPVIVIASMFYKTESGTSKDYMSNITNSENVSDEEDFFVLYNGVEIERTAGWRNLYDNMITLDETSEEKYNTKYYNYEKGKYIGETAGTFKYEGGGYLFVGDVGKIAISKKYDAIPRKSTTLNEVPEELIDMIDYSLFGIESVDLDGDGKLEYVVVCGIDRTGDEIGDGLPEASSTIMLFNSSFKKVADLVNLENGFATMEKDEDSRVFLSLDDIIYIDIDEDGIMEILINVPTYEEQELSIVKYAYGNLEGDIDIEANVFPGIYKDDPRRQALEKYLTLYSLSDDGAPLLCSYDLIQEYGLQLYSSYEEMEKNLESSEETVVVDGYEIPLEKTNIEYERYKSEMLNYVSEELFEKQFTIYHKNFDGILYVVSNAGDGESYKIFHMEELNSPNVFRVAYYYGTNEWNPDIKKMIVTFEEKVDRSYIVADCEFEES